MSVKRPTDMPARWLWGTLASLLVTTAIGFGSAVISHEKRMGRVEVIVGARTQMLDTISEHNARLARLEVIDHERRLRLTRIEDKLDQLIEALRRD